MDLSRQKQSAAELRRHIDRNGPLAFKPNQDCIVTIVSFDILDGHGFRDISLERPYRVFKDKPYVLTMGQLAPKVRLLDEMGRPGAEPPAPTEVWNWA